GGDGGRARGRAGLGHRLCLDQRRGSARAVRGRRGALAGRSGQLPSAGQHRDDGRFAGRLPPLPRRAGRHPAGGRFRSGRRTEDLIRRCGRRAMRPCLHASFAERRMSLIGETQAAGPGDLIKEGSDAAFGKDVIEASREQPVIVDFWATWCGPCKTLGPALEKAVMAAKGAVRLVKVDVDKNPRIASQLRVQSIPTVYAFVDGQPVDGFMGAVPASQLKSFIDRLTGPAAPSDLEQVLAMAAESLELGDIGGAAQAFAQALQLDPANAKAIAGLARCYLQGGDIERAREIVAMAP